ncbi:unnamed protein product [Paramecium pentaurelia]|uniref:Cyclic nucleotide-binding domain-containing protein n=1 Tax=Paramecium pentaurelia TaxID=43138 RepID=A0A8S1SEZ2_9CILI|nr:unnamed protein product [Paramecium pentaurelia]
MNLQPVSSGSINMSGDSNQNGLDHYLNELNNQNLMQVRRPNEEQILAFIDFEGIKPDQAIQHKTFPDSHKENKSKGSKSSQQIRRNSLDLSEVSPLKQSLRDDLIPCDSPNIELKKLGDPDDHRKSKTVISPAIQSSKSPKRKSKHFSKIFSKITNRMHLAKKFIQKIKLLSPFAKKIQKQQLQLIQDLSSDINNCNEKYNNNSFIRIHDKSKQKKVLKRIESMKAFIALKTYFSVCKIQVIFDKLKNETIDPQGNFLFIWELLKFFMTLASLFQLSIQICFNLDVLNWFFISEKENSQIILIMMFIYYSFDIVLGFRTGYYENGEVVTKQQRVARRYLRKYFFVDLISIIPIFVNIILIQSFETDNTIIKIVNCLSFLRSNALNRVYHSLEGRLLSNPRFVIGYRFLSVIGTVFLYAHVFGCLWYVVAQNNQNNWINKAGIVEDSWFALYSYSIYWSVMTMTTVGYGDLTPANHEEALFCVCTMFIASVVFAYSINTIGMIITEMNKFDEKINENMAIINRYMQRKNFEQSLQFRVRQYLQNLWTQEEKFRIVDENKIINCLSPNLKEEIQICLYGQFITSIHIFYRYFSQECLLDLTKSVQEYRVAPNSYVIENGTHDGIALYQLVSGEAEMFVDLQDRKYYIGKMKQGDIFGHGPFFMNNVHPYSIKTDTACSFSYLSKQMFLDILQSHPGDYQTYRMIIDQWTFQNQKLDLGVKCLGCGETDHDIDQCHRLHLIINKQILLTKHLFSVPNKRILFHRNSRRTTNAKFGQRLFEDAVSLFQENNYSFSSEEEEPNPSQIERTHQTKQTQDIRYQEPTHNTHRSQQQQQQQQQQHQQSKNVRFRKRSRSLNSISVHSDEESKFQKSISGYKSNDSQIDKISGIPVKVQQLPSSQLSQSSFNVFLKEYPKRKISKQQDSDKYSNHSIGQRQQQQQQQQQQQHYQQQQYQHKSSSQSSSGNIPQSSIGISPIPTGSPPLLYQEDKQTFQKGVVEDSLFVAQERKKKSLIGTSYTNTKSIKNPLQAIPSVSEMNETEKNNNNLKEGSYTSKQLSMQSRSRSQRYTISIRTESQKIREDTKHDTTQKHDFKIKTDTYKQYHENSPLNEEQFHNTFEQACNLNSYYPQYNKDRIIEKYKRQQYRKNNY